MVETNSGIYADLSQSSVVSIDEVCSIKDIKGLIDYYEFSLKSLENDVNNVKKIISILKKEE